MTIRRFTVEEKYKIRNSGNLRIMVDGTPGTFDNYFPLFKKFITSTDNTFSLDSDILDNTIYPYLRKNEKTHKVELSYLVSEDQKMWLTENFLESGRLIDIHVSLVRRVGIISGLALTASIPDSTMRIYNGTLSSKNEIYDISYNNLNLILAHNGALSKRSNLLEMYNHYFSYFWFNYDRSITEHDDILIKETLKMM